MSKLILETLFSSNLRVKILKYLFHNVNASFSVKELSTHVQENTNAVSREIAKLKEIGLVKIKK